ncbi:hypothetical protein Alches_16230 [Alicyclobacillus hesperidum subsp. aegles]|uniref:hypothetical protein n=1 Tax=Alicyclobacillus hesperidum TaxID=89784 RepID=UPI00222CABBF|nr:hypothetical protein [Alicyclobacillus hesperidum]GLG01583.1 hypothetical protein Alches_16230 [Alicyclobacillus hesperidum subsp. aegles]
MDEKSQEVTLAVAVTEISYIKETLKETNEDVKHLLRRMDEQSQLYATKAELGDLKRDVEKLKTWRNYVGGGMALGGFLLGLVAEAWRSWKG